MSISVQLYSVRQALAADLPGTITRLARIGFTQVEPYNFVATAAELADALAANRMTAPTAHAPLLTGDPDEIFATASRLGIGTVIEPHIPKEQWSDAASIRDAAARLNRVAKRGADHGVRVGYHNHWWELQGSIDGTTPLEYFETLMDPELVLQIDTYWAAVGGVDPAGLLTRLRDRVVTIHIKDGPKTLDTRAQLPAGRGAIDIPGVVSAASALQVEVIEFDDYAGDIFDALEASLRYVSNLLTDS